MLLRGANMIKTINILKEELNNYKAPENKIARMVKQGMLYPIRRGIYETRRDIPGYLIAGSVYGPSYLSFDFALSRYGLIPEAVYTFTSATYGKKKNKTYQNIFGTYTYRDIPGEVYHLGIMFEKEREYIYQIATPEKALCDKLYISPVIHNKKELYALLFDDLRIDEDEFAKMDRQRLLDFAPRYRSTNLNIFCKILKDYP